MVFIKFLLTFALVSIAQAGYVWQNDDDNSFPGFEPIKMPNFYFPPLPPPPPLPPIPPLPTFGPMTFPPFPNYPPLPNIPSPGEIKNKKPEPGQIYSGIAVKSASGYKTGKDGKLVKNGGTVVVTNDNGDVKEFKVGDNPPNINEPIQAPSFPEFKPIHFEPITFPPIKQINPDDIKNHKPDDNEHFIGYSTSTFSHSSDIDGVKSSGGGSNTVLNVDGKVDEEAVRMGQHDKKKQ